MCRSWSEITWSSNSRRQLPIRLSATPFCQGAWRLVLGLQAHGAQRIQDLGIETGVPIQNRVSVRDRVAKCLAQLLDYPVRSRVRRHVEMQNPAPTMFDHE
jgi:hypothetical protein